jgi:two-component system sensor histidine kinase CpxA
MSSNIPIKFPLYIKILLWFFLNLLVLGLAFYAFLTMHMNLGWDTLLMGRVGERLRAVGEVISRELTESTQEEWNPVLDRFSNAYQVTFRLFSHDGNQMAGPPVDLPPTVMQKFSERFTGPGRGMGGLRLAESRPQSVDASGFRPETRFLLKTKKPTRYWTGMDIASPKPGFGPRKTTLLIEAKAIHGNGLFLDLRHLGMIVLAAVMLSALVWLPFVTTLTRSLKHLTRITERIAEGDFQARTSTPKRHDEIGHLSHAVNQMAHRLDGYVTSQKRFLSDTAHELCSPLARMELGLSIIEQRTKSEEQASLKDVRDEVEVMTTLVNDLLAYSRSSLRRESSKPSPIKLWSLVEKVARQEVPSDFDFQTEIPKDIKVIADAHLLERSLANILRNAVRYAGEDGPIKIRAIPLDKIIQISISDQGPGVPAESLEHLFDPFYRPAAARERSSGGAGLGLSIVKTGIEACAGSVTCANLKPRGFEVRVELPVYDGDEATPPLA